MKKLKIAIFIVIICCFVSCVQSIEKVRHEDYNIGNEKEYKSAKSHINIMKAIGRYPDTVNYNSYHSSFPAVFGKTDYNAVMYHRKYIDTIVLDAHASKIYYDFLYLIEQDTCLDISDYLGYIDKDYTMKYRE